MNSRQDVDFAAARRIQQLLPQLPLRRAATDLRDLQYYVSFRQDFIRPIAPQRSAYRRNNQKLLKLSPRGKSQITR
jgi:hypothetical protein